MANTFSEWLDSILKEFDSDEIIAFNFNLYENSEDGIYDVQLIGSTDYDPDDDDWACNEAFSSGEDIFSFAADDWEVALEECVGMVKSYLSSGSYRSKLLAAKAIAAGFVDGDLELIHTGA